MWEVTSRRFRDLAIIRAETFQVLVARRGNSSYAKPTIASIRWTWAHTRFGGLVWTQEALGCGSVPEAAIHAASAWVAHKTQAAQQRPPATTAAVNPARKKCRAEALAAGPTGVGSEGP